jgi:DNA-directed RNA polymerase alpha subunit
MRCGRSLAAAAWWRDAGDDGMNRAPTGARGAKDSPNDMAGKDEYLDRLATAAADAQSALDKMSQANPFRAHGFSPRTEKVLRKWGIESPEQLLDLSVDYIRTIPGVGRLAMTEIQLYLKAVSDLLQ